MRRFLAFTVVAAVIILTAGFGWAYFTGYIAAGIGYLEAPPNVRELARQSHFNDTGARYFYAARPEITNKETVGRACASVASEGLLGCYTGRRIFVLDVADAQFKSETPVTAAHETLHAAYDHLSPSERRRVEGLLDAELKRRNDSEVNERIAKYPDRTSQLDEAFAILGSEAPDSGLSPELAQVFSRYFDDRQAVVDSHLAFQAQFDQLEAKINGSQAELERRKRQLEQLQAVGDIDGYNAGVGPYNNLVRQHNDLVNQFNELGTRFNRAIGSSPEK